MGGNSSFDLNNSRSLKNEMNAVLSSAFNKHKIFRNYWLYILIGISKIINTFALSWLYMWQVPWQEKLGTCIFFVVLTSLTLLIEKGLPLLWWPNYFAIFEDSRSDKKFVVCINVPFYSGKYHITIHPTNDTSYFKKLSKPIYENTFNLSQFFTEKGNFLKDEWNLECERIISTILSYKAM